MRRVSCGLLGEEDDRPGDGGQEGRDEARIEARDCRLALGGVGLGGRGGRGACVSGAGCACEGGRNNALDAGREVGQAAGGAGDYAARRDSVCAKTEISDLQKRID